MEKRRIAQKQSKETMMAKAKAMTNKQVIEAIAAQAVVSKQDIKLVLDALADLAASEAKNGFKIPGIGKLVLVDRAARAGRNPKTGETIEIPARKAVKFRVSAECKRAVLGG